MENYDKSISDWFQQMHGLKQNRKGAAFFCRTLVTDLINESLTGLVVCVLGLKVMEKVLEEK